MTIQLWILVPVTRRGLFGVFFFLCHACAQPGSLNLPASSCIDRICLDEATFFARYYNRHPVVISCPTAAKKFTDNAALRQDAAQGRLFKSLKKGENTSFLVFVHT